MKQKKSTPAISSYLSEKMITAHSFILLGVCIIFAGINLIGSSFLTAGLVVGCGVITFLTPLVLKKTAVTTRGFVLSVIQLLIIIVMSIIKHEMQDMFPLMIASMAIAAIYYNKKCLITHWAIMDVAAIGGIFFNETFYGGAGLESLIKGIAGINIGAFLIMYMVNCSLRFIAESQAAKAEADSLVSQVKDNMAEAQKLAEQQTSVVEQIAALAETLTASGNKIHLVADDINEAAEKQQVTIEEISSDIESITAETRSSLDAAEKAAAAAQNSTVLLNESNEEMLKMSAAMDEIEESSAKIRDIVKAIEDIAFQTNILALIASIEAARAGAAGKCFAVVADEVRNLANKSQDAVQSTSVLIQASNDAVQRGKAVADGVAERMSAVIHTAEESAAHAESIAQLTEKQAEAINAVKDKVLHISDVIAETSRTAEQSVEIAASVAQDSHRMDEIVSEFR